MLYGSNLNGLNPDSVPNGTVLLVNEFPTQVYKIKVEHGWETLEFINGVLQMPGPRLIHSTGTWHGVKFHTIEPTNYLPNWDNQIWDEMTRWCTNTFGTASDLWSNDTGRWYVNNSKFWFRNGADATAFTLRWQS